MTTECVEWISDEICAGLPIRLISEILERKHGTVPSPNELYQDIKGQIPTRHVMINNIVVANFGCFEQLISKQCSQRKQSG